MRSVMISLFLTLRTSLRHRAALQLEILALRHQLQVLEIPPSSGAAHLCGPNALGVAVASLERMEGRRPSPYLYGFAGKRRLGGNEPPSHGDCVDC